MYETTVNHFLPGWYVAYTRPKHERTVFSRLSDCQLNVFLPTTKKLRKWNDRKKYIDTPLFPSYLFVYLMKPQDYYTALGIESILYFVRTGKEISRVSDAVINNIRLIISQGCEVEVDASNFPKGKQLYIQNGPLTGLSCEVVEYNSKKQILVRVHLLQRNLLIALPSDHLLSHCII